MKTKDLLSEFRKNKTIAAMVPEWACRSVPVPFFRDGIPFIGFYFYPVRRSEGKTRILTPILQFVVSHANGHVVSAVAAPFFLRSGESVGADLGEYPNPALRGLPFAEAEATLERYYEMCDRYLEGGSEEEWRKAFEGVSEPGLATLLERFRDAAPKHSQASVKTISEPPCKLPAPTVGPASSFRPAKTITARAIPAVASDIRAFLSETPFSSHIPELDAAVATFQRAVFHVAIVGEFSRGKSTFLNELIGNGPLPVGDLPTTAIPARIAGGRVNKVLFRSKGQPPREIPFSQEALDAFSAADDGKDPEGSLDVSVAESWLQSLPVVFFDTPGVGDAIGRRADLARAVIAGCDCTVVVVAASSPCSLTELAFLRDGVVARKVPRVAVLVTKLDLVPEKERARVIDYVRDRIRTVAPEAETWVARLTPGIDLDSAHCVGVEAIRRRISDMCSEPDVVARRRMQLIGSLENVLTAVSEDLATREKAIGLSREKRAEAQQKLEANQKHFELLWDEILVECDTGTACLEQWVASELNSVRDSLIEDFIHSLRNCSDAKLRQWAEEEFPYRAKREIPRRIREQFQPKLLTKLGQLAQETTRLAKERFSVSGLDFTFTPEPAPESGTIGDLKADDRAIRRIQTGATIVKVAAVPIAMLGLILVGGPMGIAYALGSAGALGGGFLAGKKAEAKAAELRAVLERGVKEEIGRVFKEQSNSARELVQKAYGQLQAAIKSKMRKMLDEGLKALDESLESSIDATGINALRGRLETLRERLSTATHG